MGRSSNKSKIFVNISLLQALSSCNCVKIQVFGYVRRLLQLVPSQHTITSGNHLGTWDGNLVTQCVSTIGYLMCKNLSCTCHTLVLSGVDELDYYCDCVGMCQCRKLHIPAKFNGRTLIIRRNGAREFVVDQKEYEDYVGFKACYTYDPDMIIRTPDGLRINYERYYAELLGSENHNIEFRISQNGIITKDTIGIPLTIQVIRDFGFTQYEYHFNDFDTLKAEVDQIEEVIGQALLKLVKIKAPTDNW